MFDAVLDVKLGYVICGIIWSLALGFAVGNYACSLVHRLPRQRLILDKPPYCGHCGQLLATRDLFPVFSAVLLRHRCRYCREPFPVSHTWTELLVGLLFTLVYLKYGYGEHYILLVAVGVFLIVLAAIHANEGMVMGSMVLMVLILGVMFRILQDGTLYHSIEGGLYALILGAVLWRKNIRKVGHIYTLPMPAQLLAVGGVCAGATLLPQFIVLYACFYALGFLFGSWRGRAYAYTIAYGFALMFTLIYPGLLTGYY